MVEIAKDINKYLYTGIRNFVKEKIAIVYNFFTNYHLWQSVSIHLFLRPR